jgi:integrase
MLKIIFEQFKENIGNPELKEITETGCEVFIYKKANISHYTAQKYLAYLRAAFNKALDRGLIEKNPFGRIKNFRIPETLPKFFTKEEFQKLLEVVNDEDLKDLIIFALNTGLRQMELVTLNWKQIDFFSKTLILNKRI